MQLPQVEMVSVANNIPPSFINNYTNAYLKNETPDNAKHLGLIAVDYDYFKTIDNKRVSNNITALCKGCGICGATCRSGAITMNHFKDEQILAQIEAATA